MLHWTSQFATKFQVTSKNPREKMLHFESPITALQPSMSHCLQEFEEN